MRMIKGITVTLFEQKETGTDWGGNPIVEETGVDVENVLVAPASSTDIVDSTTLYGKKAVYTLGIPKGDTHEWEDRKVFFFGAYWKTFGFVTKGIDALVPTEWNGKIMVERYE